MQNLDNFIKECADNIQNDKIHSASYIQNEIIEYIKKFVNTRSFYKNRTELLQGLAKLSNAVCKAKSSMGGIFNITHRILNYIEELPKHERNIDHIRQSVLTELDSIRKFLETAKEEIKTLGPRLIINHNIIFTLSYSSYIRDILLQARALRRRFKVHILKSSPRNEGEILAEELIKAGIRVQLFPDSEFVRAIKDSTFVILGTDRILENSFVNKTGSYTACIVAKEFDIPVYLVADTFKILLRREYLLRFFEESNEEITSLQHEKLHVQNIYFEETPLDYVSKIVLERGIFEKDEFVKRFLE